MYPSERNSRNAPPAGAGARGAVRGAAAFMEICVEKAPPSKASIPLLPAVMRLPRRVYLDSLMS